MPQLGAQRIAEEKLERQFKGGQRTQTLSELSLVLENSLAKLVYVIIPKQSATVELATPPEKARAH